jgi:hypothetical protein
MSVENYLALITSEHQDQPHYAAFMSIFLQGQVDNQAVLSGLVQQFDLDVAVGTFLDAIGVRVGRSRYLEVPLTGVYFAWDTDFVGWDQGAWQGPFAPDYGMIWLPDETYRLLLKSTIAANQWDGSAPSAYHVFSIAYGEGMMELYDNQDMSISMRWVGPDPDAVLSAIIQAGYLSLTPAGVSVTTTIGPSLSTKEEDDPPRKPASLLDRLRRVLR